MCSQKFGWQLALEITALNMVDPLLYEILGDGEKLRVGLLDMVNPETSPVCVCEKRLLDALLDFTPSSKSWQLFHALGGRVDDEEAWRDARSKLLQFSCGLLDHFSLRYSCAPYTLGKLACSSVRPEEKNMFCNKFSLCPDIAKA